MQSPHMHKTRLRRVSRSSQQALFSSVHYSSDTAAMQHTRISTQSTREVMSLNNDVVTAGTGNNSAALAQAPRLSSGGIGYSHGAPT